MSFSSFFIKYKRPLGLVIFILLGFILVQVSASIKEGLETTDWTKLTKVATCTRETSCSTCVSSYFGVTGSQKRCAWNMNPSNKQYSCITSDDNTPVGEFSCPLATSVKPGCTACPKLKLLDTPTWILDQ